MQRGVATQVAPHEAHTAERLYSFMYSAAGTAYLSIDGMTPSLNCPRSPELGLLLLCTLGMCNLVPSQFLSLAVHSFVQLKAVCGPGNEARLYA